MTKKDYKSIREFLLFEQSKFNPYKNDREDGGYFALENTIDFVDNYWLEANDES